MVSLFSKPQTLCDEGQVSLQAQAKGEGGVLGKSHMLLASLLVNMEGLPRKMVPSKSGVCFNPLPMGKAKPSQDTLFV